MRDVLGHRLKLGVLTPSTNTVVEPEYHELVPDGVTVQTGRLLISRPSLGTDTAFEDLIGQVRDALGPTIDNLVTCKPDHLALGMTALSFLGAVEGNERLTTQMADRAGVPVTTGPTAMLAALRTVGARRIGLLTPYEPRPEGETVRFFEESGIEVAHLGNLRSESATAIATRTPGEIAHALREVDGPEVEAIVQVGTNLAMARLADFAEAWFDKPVLAINTATVWHVLRQRGLEDRRDGFGALLRDH